MSKLGQYLQENREKQGISLDKLHEETKIRKLYLESLEAGNFDVLPGEVYLKGFLRTIARELSLEYNTLLKLYSEDTGVEHVPPELIINPDFKLKQDGDRQRLPLSKETLMIAVGLVLIAAVLFVLSKYF